MDPSPWSPYSQQYSHVGGGSPQRSLVLPSPLPREDSINSYGSTNSHSLLMSSCQGLPSLPPRPNTADPTVRPTLLNSRFESSILSPPLHSSKDPPEYFSDNLYNGVCKENQSGIRSFIQTSGSSSRNESSGFTGSENSNSGFSSQVPPISFHSTTIDRPSPGPFGVLPHEAVRPNRFDRNSDKFITPVSKSISSAFSTGSYSDHDVNSSYTSAPIPSQPSVFASDNASHSPIVNPVTSPSMSTFSSPNDYYSSPKPGFGPYNSMQSPLAQSPSVAQHSYPPSPYVDSGHISSAPPCSPMNGSSYVNNLPDRGVIVSQVPPRNGHKTQHSPSNNASGSSVICYNPQQTQNAVHHGPQPPVSKTPDYHSDYSVFSHDQNLSPSSYSSVYPAMHSAQVPSGSASRISPRSHGQHSNASHDSRLSYTLPSPLPSSTISSPTYMQSKSSGMHDTTFGTCSSSMAGGQPLHPPAYPQCTSVIDSSRHRSVHPNSILPNHMPNDRQYSYQSSDITDDKNALDMFNSHIDSGVHNPDTCQSSISSFLENDLPILDPDLLTTSRQLRDSDSSSQQPHHNEINMEAPGRGIIAHTQMSVVHNSQDLTGKPRMNYSYDSNMNIDMRSVPFPFGSAPRKRGRRGRRRKIDIAAGEGYPRMPYKNEHNVIFRNGYPVSASKFAEYGNRNCYNAYAKRFKEGFENNEAPSHYSMFMPPFNNERKNCSNYFMDKLKSYPTIEDDLKFLGKFSFICEDDGKDIPQTFMKTRNKDSEGFLQSFLNFLEVRKTNPESEGESGAGEEKSGNGEDSSKNNRDHKGRPSLSRSVPKVIIKMGRCNNPGEWRLTETHHISPERFSNSGDESASSESSAENSSHGNKKLKLDKLSASNLRNMSSGDVHVASDRLSKLNSRRNFEHVGGTDKYSDVAESDLHFTNSETLVGGEMSRKKNNGAGCSQRLAKDRKTPKKRGRKAKTPLTENSTVKEQPHNLTIRTGTVELLGESLPPSDPGTSSVNTEDKSDENAVSRRLRARKEEPAVKDGDVSGGASAKPGTVGLAVSSDEGDLFDDSDSDPAWTPSARTNKPDLGKIYVSDSALKRRRKKIFRKSGTVVSPIAAKKRATKVLDASKSDPVPKVKKTPQKKVKVYTGFKGRSPKKGDTFLILKADLNKDRPSIWRLNNETRLLQRFDPYEEQGVQLHRRTYAFAGWSPEKEVNYTKVNAKTIARSRALYVVQYLGLPTSVVPSEGTSTSSASATVSNPLRENFEVFLQTLISQALDPNFLSEITNENDEYFLSNIREIEKVTEDKKMLLCKDTWDQELKKCAEIYPCVNILDHVNNGGVKCQVCGITDSEKLLQFYGQPYDWTTLGSVESPLANKTQFNVCAICSATVSLYNRLHHQKYNFFIKCRTKMNQVKGDIEQLQSHALLHNCLSDSSWVNMLFLELESIWNECDKKS